MTHNEVCLILGSIFDGMERINEFDKKINDAFGYCEIDEINETYTDLMDASYNILLTYMGYGAGYGGEEVELDIDTFCDIWFALTYGDPFILYDLDGNECDSINDVEELVNYCERLITS
mgnify:CR=1 FL=1